MKCLNVDLSLYKMLPTNQHYYDKKQSKGTVVCVFLLEYSYGLYIEHRPAVFP